MSENIPSVPAGAVPPKPAEAAKVQPKKETVRINLPPKPTSAPTIKLPTLAPGGPPSVGGASAAAPAAPRAAAPPSSAAAPAAPVAAAPPSRAGATATRAPAAPAPAQRPAPVMAPQAATIKKLDKGLAIAAVVFVLAGVGTTLWMLYGAVPGLAPIQ